jgi:hypothetical protein
MPRVTLRANGVVTPSYLVKLPETYAGLLKLADVKLGEGFGAKRIFTQNAAEIHEEEFELIEDNDVLYVSRGEDWIQPPAPPATATSSDAAGAAPAATAPLPWPPAKPPAQASKELPPGWVAVRHEPPSGAYTVYEGPAGKKVRSIKDAWRVHENLPPPAKKPKEDKKEEAKGLPRGSAPSGRAPSGSAPSGGTPSGGTPSAERSSTTAAAAAPAATAVSPHGLTTAPKSKQAINPADFFAKPAKVMPKAAVAAEGAVVGATVAGPDAAAAASSATETGRAAPMELEADSATGAEGAPVEASVDDEDDEDDEVFEVAGIVDERTATGGTTEYLIVWRGYGEDANTWEPSDNIFDETLVTDFREREAMLMALDAAQLRAHIEAARATLPAEALPPLPLDTMPLAADAAAAAAAAAADGANGDSAPSDAAGTGIHAAGGVADPDTEALAEVALAAAGSATALADLHVLRALARRAEQLKVQQQAMADGPARAGGEGSSSSSLKKRSAPAAGGGGAAHASKRARKDTPKGVAVRAEKEMARLQKSAETEAARLQRVAEAAAKAAETEAARLQRVAEAAAKAAEREEARQRKEAERVAREQERLIREAEKAARAAEKEEEKAHKEAERLAKEKAKQEEVRQKEEERRLIEQRKAEQMQKLEEAKKRQSISNFFGAKPPAKVPRTDSGAEAATASPLPSRSPTAAGTAGGSSADVAGAASGAATASGAQTSVGSVASVGSGAGALEGAPGTSASAGRIFVRGGKEVKPFYLAPETTLGAEPPLRVPPPTAKGASAYVGTLLEYLAQQPSHPPPPRAPASLRRSAHRRRRVVLSSTLSVTAPWQWARMKTLAFDEDVRPAYHGTFTHASFALHAAAEAAEAEALASVDGWIDSSMDEDAPATAPSLLFGDSSAPDTAPDGADDDGFEVGATGAVPGAAPGAAPGAVPGAMSGASHGLATAALVASSRSFDSLRLGSGALSRRRPFGRDSSLFDYENDSEVCLMASICLAGL